MTATGLFDALGVIPALSGARCRGRHHLFDPRPADDLGDFSNFVICDRLGLATSFIPHLFHTSNNRPSGQAGFYATFRSGSDSVNDGAFRLLDVT